MMKKNIILLLLVLTLPALSAEFQDSNIHAGTPAGFYDDIDPATLDDEDSEIPDTRNAPALRDGTNNQNVKPQTSVYKEEDDDEIPFIHYSEGQFQAGEEVKPTKDYSKIYSELELPDFSYLHDIDPDQYYDMKDTAWSIYPLFRLNSPIYFKNITIEPGYYLITPRENNGKWYILFKQNGLVKHIIPVYEREYTPENFYDEHIPKPKLTKSQKIHMGILDFLGNFNSTKRKEPVQTYLEVNDLDNYFISIIIYYGGHKYSTLFRTIRL